MLANITKYAGTLLGAGLGVWTAAWIFWHARTTTQELHAAARRGAKPDDAR